MITMLRRRDEGKSGDRRPRNVLPDRYEYTDLAIAPVTDDEVVTHEMLPRHPNTDLLSMLRARSGRSGVILNRGEDEP